MKTFRTLIQSGLSMMLLLGAATLFTGQAHAQFSAQFSTPIHDVDNAARQPVQFVADLGFADGSSNSFSFFGFTVPAGKRLVIETISAEIFVPIGQQVSAQVNTRMDNGFSPFVILPFTYKFTNNSEDGYIATIAVRMYSDPGTTPEVTIFRNSTQGLTTQGAVQCFGYLVDLP
ncbi:MAG TPA: hypothetical protein VK673_17675 [Chthoniobacterales bacterium]|nr:hypothetical protein [Chthoniobacterales bacterium]